MRSIPRRTTWPRLRERPKPKALNRRTRSARRLGNLEPRIRSTGLLPLGSSSSGLTPTGLNRKDNAARGENLSHRLAGFEPLTEVEESLRVGLHTGPTRTVLEF